MSSVMPSFHEASAGFPVICLHASAGGPAQWRTLMAHLAGRYRVLAPNRIGYEVAALAPLPDAAGPSWALVGHSFGAAVHATGATTTARANPFATDGHDSRLPGRQAWAECGRGVPKDPYAYAWAG